jgi:hypothetical protein
MRRARDEDPGHEEDDYLDREAGDHRRRRRGLDHYQYGAGRSELHDDPDGPSQGARNYGNVEEWQPEQDYADDAEPEESEPRPRERLGYRSNERRPERMSHSYGVRGYEPGAELSHYQARQKTGEDHRRRFASDRRYRADGRARDMPPAFAGRPTPGGKLVGAMDWLPDCLRIRTDDGYGLWGSPSNQSPSPPVQRLTRRAQMAFDSRARRVRVPSIDQMFPGIERIRIGY